MILLSYLGGPPADVTSHPAASHVGMLVGLANHSWGHTGEFTCSVGHHREALHLHACMTYCEAKLQTLLLGIGPRLVWGGQTVQLQEHETWSLGEGRARGQNQSPM